MTVQTLYYPPRKVLLFCGAAAGVVVAAVASAQQSLYNDPSSFFGGKDHDAYLTWLADRAEGEPVENDFPNSVFLPSVGDDDGDGVAVHWKIDEDDDDGGHLSVMVAARATGWVGFGISEAGGMPGSDVVLYKASEPDMLVDAHIIDLSGPVEDECQHWELTDSYASEGFLIFEAKRRVDTFDDQDLPLRNDAASIVPSTRVVAAWGDDDPKYHGRNRATGAVRFFREESGAEEEVEAFRRAMSVKSDSYFDIGASVFEIPSTNDTLYQSFCMTWNDVLAADVPDVDGLTVVGFEPIIDEDARKHVHHFILVGGPRPRNNDTCEEITEDTFGLMYAWAPGEPPFELPDEAGFALGPTGNYQSFRLEIHYDNPNFVSGIADSSVVRVYYSETPRKHEMGVLETGDPFVNLNGQPLGEGLVEHAFYCGSECSASALAMDDEQNPGGVTVVREHLHMHNAGVHMYNEQIRNGTVLRTGTVQFFNFNQQGNPAVQQEPFQVLPGDEFKTVCHFESGSQEKWGLKSSDEMCITFLFYYPRRVFGNETTGEFPWICGVDIPIPQCASEYENKSLSTVSDLERTFGRAPDQCQNAVRGDVSDPNEMSSTVLGPVASVMTALFALFITIFSL